MASATDPEDRKGVPKRPLHADAMLRQSRGTRTHIAGTGLKLLCIADIHLGRQPSRVPERVNERFEGRQLGPAGAWMRAVGYAIEQDVDGVLLAGDVVEQEDDFHEAFIDLRQGVEQLTAAGIAVLGVTGNHDVRVLPRLAEAIPDFRLLGAGGQWQAAVVEGADGRRARVLGWSFPEPVVHTSPLAAGLPPRESLPTIGLLHCDRDQPGSRYAPVAGAELQQAPVDAWLLGHIHKPDPLGGQRPMGYLGSLTGMDPGETGAHGPWLLTIGGDGGIAAEQVPLAPLRWIELAVAVDDLASPEDIHRQITDAIDRAHTELATLAHRPAAVGCRLRLTGRTNQRAELERTLDADDPRQAPAERDGTVYFVHDWHLDVQPTIDLTEAAQGTDPVALLARKLLILRGADSAERRALIGEARDRLAEIPRRRPYNVLGAEAPGDADLAATLEAAAQRALDDLLRQRDNAP